MSDKNLNAGGEECPVEKAINDLDASINTFAEELDEGYDRVWDDFVGLRNQVHALKRQYAIIDRASGCTPEMQHRTKSVIAFQAIDKFDRWQDAFRLCWELRRISEEDEAIVKAIETAADVAEKFYQDWQDHLNALQPYRDYFVENKLGEMEEEIADIKDDRVAEPIASILSRAKVSEMLKDRAHALYGVESPQHKRAGYVADWWHHRSRNITRYGDMVKDLLLAKVEELKNQTAGL